MGVIRVGAIQLRAGTNLEVNRQALQQAVREASAAGALYIQTPEMSGILQKDRADLFSKLSHQNDDPLVEMCSALAKEMRIYLHIGSHAVLVGEGKAANRAFLFGPTGQLITTYDKIHMFDVDLGEGNRWRESAAYEAGEQAVVAKLVPFTLGLSICYDLRFPVLYQALARAGASVMAVPSVFTVPTGKAHWHSLLRARAIENGAFVIAAAQGGQHEDGRESFGHSMIVNPWGDIVCELDHAGPGTLVADIDLGEVAKARTRIPNLDNQKRFTTLTVTDIESGETATKYGVGS